MGEKTSLEKEGGSPKIRAALGPLCSDPKPQLTSTASSSGPRLPGWHPVLILPQMVSWSEGVSGLRGERYCATT